MQFFKFLNLMVHSHLDKRLIRERTKSEEREAVAGDFPNNEK
jgi:hypothetical protein